VYWIADEDTGNFGYARVSSDEQARGWSVDRQVARLKEVGCTRIYADVGISAYKDAHRPDYSEMQHWIRSGFANGRRLIVTDQDRLSRNEIVTFELFDLLEAKGCQYQDLSRPDLDPLTPEGRRLIGYAAADSRHYSAKLSRKVREGHRYHRDRNAPYAAPWGYKVVREKLVLNHDHCCCTIEDRKHWSYAEVGRWLIGTMLATRSARKTLHSFNAKFGIVAFRGRGGGNRRPRKALGFGSSGFTSWLNNPILQGHTCYGRGRGQRMKHQSLWDIRYDTHPDQVLMNPSEWREIEAMLKWSATHTGYWNTPLVPHSTSGLVYCQACGSATTAQSFTLRSDRSIRKYSYQCSNYRLLRACDQKKSVREYIIINVIIEALTAKAKEIAGIALVPPTAEESMELKELKAQLAALQQIPGTNLAIDKAKADLEKQIHALSYQSTEQDHKSALLQAELVELFSNSETFANATPEEQAIVFRSLVSRVWIRDGVIQSVELKV
jgi:site-specific DNA recombinase